MKKLIGILLFVLVVSILYTNWSHNQKPPQPSTLEKVSFIFPTVAQIEWAPFYTAAGKGFYKDEGLEVNFEYSTKGTMTAYELLDSNQVQFMYSSTENLIKARDKGINAQAVYLLEPTNLMYIISDTKQNILKPADLKGKKVGMFSTTGTNKITLQQMLKIDNVPPEQVEMIPAGPSVVPGFLEDKYEAALVFLNQRMLIEQQGKQLNVLAAEDYGIKSKAYIVSKKEYITAHSDLMKRFLKATKKGLVFAAANPEEVVDIYATYNPDDTDNRGNNLKIWQEMVTLFGYKNTVSGQQNGGDLEYMQNMLMDLKEISQKGDVNLMYSNDFLPAQ